MDGFSDYLIEHALDRIFGAVAVASPSALTFALFTTCPNKDGSGGVEVRGNTIGANGYVRKAVINNLTNFPNVVAGSNTKKNASALTFATPTASWGDIVAIGIYDSALGAETVFTADNGTSNFTSVGHSYENYVEATGAGSVVMLSTDNGTLPTYGGGSNTPLLPNTPYYVRDVSGNSWKLSLTPGGSAINLDSDGTGTLYIRLVGNLLAACSVPSRSVPTGRPYTIHANALQLTLGVFSDYLNARILDYWFGGQAHTVPSLYLALLSAAHTSAGSGGTEFATASYARKAITNNLTNFPAVAAGTGLKYLDVDHTFTTPSEDWGTAVALALYDALTGGNMLLIKAISDTPVVDTSAPVVAASTGLRITVT